MPRTPGISDHPDQAPSRAECRPRPRRPGSRSRPPPSGGRCPRPSTPVSTSLLTMASTTSPRTSSTTAAPRMIWPSRVLSAPSSDSTRAVIPIEVAVSAAPDEDRGQRLVAERRRDRVAAGKRQQHPRQRHGQRGRSDPDQLVEVGLEPHLEEQQHDADLRRAGRRPPTAAPVRGRRGREGSRPATLRERPAGRSARPDRRTASRPEARRRRRGGRRRGRRVPRS